MTILFAGAELGSFLPSDTSAFEVTSAGPSFGPIYDPNYARCALVGGASVSTDTSFAWVSNNAIWLHMALNNSTGIGGAQPIFQVLSGATPIFQLTANFGGSSSQTYQMQYWNGAAWANVGAPFQFPSGTLQFLDIQLSAAAIWCYVAGTVKAGAAGAFPLVTAMTSLVLIGPAPFTNTPFFSEIIVSDQPTFGYRLQTLAPTGNGASQQWSGTFTNINEIVTNDGTFIATPTAAQLSTFSHSTVTTQSIRALVVTARAGTTPAAPQHMQLACVSSGTTGLSGLNLEAVGFAPNVGVFPTDPHTGAAWANAALNAVQFGVQSAA